MFVLLDFIFTLFTIMARRKKFHTILLKRPRYIYFASMNIKTRKTPALSCKIPLAPYVLCNPMNVPSRSNHNKEKARLEVVAFHCRNNVKSICVHS